MDWEAKLYDSIFTREEGQGSQKGEYTPTIFEEVVGKGPRREMLKKSIYVFVPFQFQLFTKTLMQLIYFRRK